VFIMCSDKYLDVNLNLKAKNTNIALNFKITIFKPKCKIKASNKRAIL